MARPKSDTIDVHLRLPAALAVRAKALADHDGFSLSTLVHQAVARYVGDEERRRGGGDHPTQSSPRNTPETPQSHPNLGDIGSFNGEEHAVTRAAVKQAALFPASPLAPKEPAANRAISAPRWVTTALECFQRWMEAGRAGDPLRFGGELPLAELEVPPDFDASVCRFAWAAWLGYKRRRNESYKDPAQQLRLLLAQAQQTAGGGEDVGEMFVRCVATGISQRYQGVPFNGAGKRTASGPKAGAVDGGLGGEY
jgi:hypothetical protein